MSWCIFNSAPFRNVLLLILKFLINPLCQLVSKGCIKALEAVLNDK